ncbi:hypothetical protein XENTR_v10017049 [Xenopus tropicalis]|nr:hypothetical protein XENTR_v10017049 [Xenopus tropicalis]
MVALSVTDPAVQVSHTEELVHEYISRTIPRMPVLWDLWILGNYRKDFPFSRSPFVHYNNARQHRTVIQNMLTDQGSRGILGQRE